MHVLESNHGLNTMVYIHTAKALTWTMAGQIVSKGEYRTCAGHYGGRTQRTGGIDRTPVR